MTVRPFLFIIIYFFFDILLEILFLVPCEKSFFNFNLVQNESDFRRRFRTKVHRGVFMCYVQHMWQLKV